MRQGHCRILHPPAASSGSSKEVAANPWLFSKSIKARGGGVIFGVGCTTQEGFGLSVYPDVPSSDNHLVCAQITDVYCFGSLSTNTLLFFPCCSNLTILPSSQEVKALTTLITKCWGSCNWREMKGSKNSILLWQWHGNKNLKSHFRCGNRAVPALPLLLSLILNWDWNICQQSFTPDVMELYWPR